MYLRLSILFNIYSLNNFPNEDLYAIDISNLDWRIGSIGLSGFCMWYDYELGTTNRRKIKENMQNYTGGIVTLKKNILIKRQRL